jgi:hypothetical protein
VDVESNREKETNPTSLASGDPRTRGRLTPETIPDQVRDKFLGGRVAVPG